MVGIRGELNPNDSILCSIAAGVTNPVGDPRNHYAAINDAARSEDDVD